MKDHDPVVGSLHSEAPRSSEDAMSSERLDPSRIPSVAPGGIARQRMRVAGRTLGSLLLGGAAVLGSVLVFRQGLLPLIEAVFQPGPELLSAFRRAGILLSAMASYWAYVHWHERREATELRLRPVHLMLGGVSGTVLVGLPIAVLFALGAYEKVLFRGVSPALWSVAVLIGIAAVLEELVYRCLLFRLLERALGTSIALVAQALIFAVGHLENVPHRPSAQSVGGGRQSRGVELHHTAQRRAAFRHRGLARAGAVRKPLCRARLADRGHVRSGKFAAGDRVDHGRGCAAAARGTAAWGLPRAGDLDRQARAFGMRRDADEAVGS